jgi:hypothetical protein
MRLPSMPRQTVKMLPLLAAVWVAFVTAALSPQLLFPPVEPMGVTFREDTSGVELFPLTTDGHAAIEAAVASGRLAAADLGNGFCVFMRGTLGRAAQANRVRVAERVVQAHVSEQQWAARLAIAPYWATLALLPAILLLLPAAVAFRPRTSP